MPNAKVAPTLGDDPEPKDETVADTPKPPSEPQVLCWTNQQVLRWLLQVDQKQFLAPFVLNNVTGAVLLEALEAEPASTVSLSQLAGDPPELQLAGLRGLAKQQLLRASLVSEAVDDTKGWSFDNELSELTYFFGVSTDRERANRILKHLKAMKEHVAVLTLLLSTVTTIVSVVGSSLTASDDSATALSYVTTGLSSAATLLAGFSRIYDYDKRLKEVQDYISGYCDEYTGLLEQLLLPPHARDSYSEWSARKKQRFESETQRAPEVDPDVWEDTLRQIARKQPETWRSLFAIAYHISWPGSPKLSSLKPNAKLMSEPSNVPRWAWWLGLVEFEPIFSDHARTARAMNQWSGVLAKSWPNEYKDKLAPPQD